jgi:integrase/recombinase XerD
VEEGLSTDVTQIDSKIIRRYILYLQQVKLFRDHPCNKPIDRKLTGHTINCYLRTLRTFWNWLYSEELIQSNPFAKIKIPKAPKKLIPTFSNNQIQDLLAAIDTSTPVGYRDWTILITLLDTGLRASELVGLTLDYVWIEDGLLKVLGKGNKERLVPIGATVQKAMWRYIGLHPYDWTDRVRRVWQGISLFS